jgi:hypothetical protein
MKEAADNETLLSLQSVYNAIVSALKTLNKRLNEFIFLTGIAKLTI